MDFSYISNFLWNNQGFSPEQITAISTITSYLHAWDAFLPVSEIFAVLKVVLFIEAGMLAWNVYRFIMNLVRGASA